MLFAQEVADTPNLSVDNTLLIAILVPAVFCALLVLFIVLLLRHLRFTREKLHAERLKMIEAGYPLEEPESTKRRQQYMHNAFWISFWMVFLVPSAAFSAAATATDRRELAGYVIAIWIGASAASVAAVVCAAVLMICSRCSRGDGGDVEIPTKKLKPLKMISKCTDVLTLGVSLVWLSASLAVAEETPAGPHAVENPLSPLMIAGDWVPDDPREIDFAELPRVPSQHVVVSDVRKDDGVNQHNYLVHHTGKFWAMWSDGPGIEDRVGQRVKFSTSSDGLAWSEPKYLTPEPPNSGPDSPHYATRSDKGFRWISRGFWQRGEELYALASLDEAAGFFGPSLALHAFRLTPGEQAWEAVGVIANDAINNFPPKRLPSGAWMMSRRPHDYKKVGVHVINYELPCC